MKPAADPAGTATGEIRAFWCRTPSRPNFGDALTPWLIRRLTGRYPRFAWPGDPVPKCLAVGSIAAYAGPGCTVWGSGIMDRCDPISPEAQLLALRGPLTRRRAIECGGSPPDVLGDPALLLPRLYQPPPQARHGVGVIPHFADAGRVGAAWQATPGLRLIDIQAPVETVIDQITSCRAVASSSLHGLVASHAYGIPAVWTTFGTLPNGDGSKFADYFASIGQPGTAARPADPRRLDATELARHARPADHRLDLDALWESCPFRAA